MELLKDFQNLQNNLIPNYMAKPILVINYCVDGLTTERMVRNIKELQETLRNTEIHEHYFVFMLPVKSDSHVQVFYDKDFNETQYEELKDMITKKIEGL